MYGNIRGTGFYGNLFYNPFLALPNFEKSCHEMVPLLEESEHGVRLPNSLFSNALFTDTCFLSLSNKDIWWSGQCIFIILGA